MDTAAAAAKPTDPDEATGPGRSCPIAYRYPPAVFAQPASIHARVLYVVGGLYGNPYALDAVEALATAEAEPPVLLFNGDFHWFDTDPATFATIDRRVARHPALRGNVETELAGDDDGAGCGTFCISLAAGREHCKGCENTKKFDLVVVLKLLPLLDVVHLITQFE
jgi:hypothetical protein